MDFGKLLDETYRILQDPLKQSWSNPAIALHATEAIREIAKATNTSANRIALSLVQGQQEYILPTNVRRINQVKIIPVNGGEPKFPLNEVDFSELPIDASVQGEPDRYAIRSLSGATRENLSLFLWRAPDRAGVNSIVVDVRDETIIISTDPATAGERLQNIPFPSMFDLPIIYLTCSGLLQERDDENDIVKSERFRQWAKDKIKGSISMNSDTFYSDIYRSFP